MQQPSTGGDPTPATSDAGVADGAARAVVEHGRGRRASGAAGSRPPTSSPSGTRWAACNPRRPRTRSQAAGAIGSETGNSATPNARLASAHQPATPPAPHVRGTVAAAPRSSSPAWPPPMTTVSWFSCKHGSAERHRAEPTAGCQCSPGHSCAQPRKRGSQSSHRQTRVSPPARLAASSIRWSSATSARITAFS